jgi:hypothetical protein
MNMDNVPEVITKEMIEDMKARGLYVEANELHRVYLADKKKSKKEGLKEIQRIRMKTYNFKRKVKKNG